MGKIKKKGWINLFKIEGVTTMEPTLHKSCDEAMRNTLSSRGNRFSNYVATIEIEWEEEV